MERENDQGEDIQKAAFARSLRLYLDARKTNDLNKDPDTQETMQEARERFAKFFTQQNIRESCTMLASEATGHQLTELQKQAEAKLTEHMQLGLPLRAQMNGREIQVELGNKKPFVALAMQHGLQAWQYGMPLSKWYDGSFVAKDEKDTIDEYPVYHTLRKRMAQTLYTALIVFGWHIPDISVYRGWAEDGVAIYREMEQRDSGTMPPEKPTIVDL